MASFVRQITTYSIVYSANPRITLINGNVLLGQLVFFPNGTTLPADSQSINGQVELHYHMDDFHNLVDILRNEEPVFLNFVGGGPGFINSIQTGSEPTGEGE